MDAADLKCFREEIQMSMPPDATIPADIVSRITEDDDTGDAGTKKFTQEFLDSLAGGNVGWQEEDAQDSMFVVNGEGVEYYFMPNGTMDLHGGVTNTAEVVRAINSFVSEDPTALQQGGRKTKRKTRATKKSRKSRATKKRMSRRKLTRRR